MAGGRYDSLDARQPAALVPEGSVLDVREVSDDRKWIRVRWQPAGETAAVEGWVLRANVERRQTKPKGSGPEEVEVEFTAVDGKMLGMELEWVDLDGDRHLMLAEVQEGSVAARKGLRDGLYLHTINKATPLELGDAAAQHLAHARPLKLKFGSSPRQRRTRSRSPRGRRLARQRSPSPFADRAAISGVPRYSSSAAGDASSSSTGFFSQLLSLATCAVAGGDTPTQAWDMEDVVSRWTRADHIDDVHRPVRGATSAQIARTGLPYDRVPEATGRRRAPRRDSGGNTSSSTVTIDPTSFLLSCGAASPEDGLERAVPASGRYRNSSPSSQFKPEGEYLNRTAPAGWQGRTERNQASMEREQEEKAEVERSYMEKIQAEHQRQKQLEAEVAELSLVARNSAPQPASQSHVSAQDYHDDDRRNPRALLLQKEQRQPWSPPLLLLEPVPEPEPEPKSGPTVELEVDVHTQRRLEARRPVAEGQPMATAQRHRRREQQPKSLKPTPHPSSSSTPMVHASE